MENYQRTHMIEPHPNVDAVNFQVINESELVLLLNIESLLCTLLLIELSAHLRIYLVPPEL